MDNVLPVVKPVMPPVAPAQSPRRTPAPVVIAVGLFFAVLGGAMFLAADKLYVKQREFLAHCEHAAGTVVDFETSVVTNNRNHYERETFYAPIFTFTDRSGSTHRATSKTSSGGKPGYQPGQTLPILYNPDHPDEAELDTFFASWGGPTILGGLGTVFCTMGGAMAWVGLRTMLQRKGRGGPPGTNGDGGVPRDPAILSGR